MKDTDVKELNRLAIVELRAGRLEQALACLDEALASFQAGPDREGDQDRSEAWNNRGVVLHALRRHDEALASYEEALRIQPRYCAALDNRGVLLAALSRFAEALAAFDQAIAADPAAIAPRLNRGAALQELGRHAEALVTFEQALAVDSKSAESHLAAALCRLLLLDFERGWREYEWRWQLAEFRRSFEQPLWLGEGPVSGKTVFVYAEQGLGDTIQFARYARELSRKGAKVIAHVHPELKHLLSGPGSGIQVFAQDEAVPGFDLQCPLLSLPLALRTRPETIPADIPYVSASANSIRKWQRSLRERARPRIGVVWRGNPHNKRLLKRSMPLAAFQPILEADADFVSLHKELDPGDEVLLGERSNVAHFGAKLADFSDTAALISLVDLVITIDTAVAHLAGAMGKPVWILLAYSADWRWQLERTDSPWYPTARLFRQRVNGDWAGVVKEVHRNLLGFTASFAQQTQAVHELEAGKFAEAEKLLSSAAKSQPASAQIQHLLGVALQEQDKLDRAIACYRRAVKLDPNHLDAHVSLGHAYTDGERHAEALAAYREAMRINADDEAACTGAASALRELGDISAARKLFQRALWLRLRRLLRIPRWRGS